MLEMNPVHPHYIGMQTVPRKEKPIGHDELITQVLTMRPDRIILEEMREAAEAAAYMKIISHGHDGALASGHSKNPRTFMNLMVVWLQESGMKVEEHFIRQMLHDALHWLAFTKRLKNGTRKVMTMWEVLPYEKGKDGFNLLYYYDVNQKRHIQCRKLTERIYQQCLENDIVIPEKFVERKEVPHHV